MRTRRKLFLPVIEVCTNTISCLLVWANVPKIFKELISVFLHGLGDFGMAYLDDIIISGTSEEEHKQHIQKIFDCLRPHNLKIKLSKFKFMQKET